MSRIFFVFFLLLAIDAYAVTCPTDAVISVSCSNASAIQHIKNKHCKTPGSGAEQFSKYYCDDIVGACEMATTDPDVSWPNNCYKKGEDGEIVGYLSDGSPTNCYHVNFVEGRGLGTMVLKTMYPDKEQYCKE